MATNKRTPNTGLARLLDEARWSHTQLAQAVNRTGAEAGLALKYDQSAVSHWLSGTMPSAKVRPVILEVFSRRLKRPVTYAEAGLAMPKGSGRHADGDAVEQLLDITRADMDPSRRGVLTAGLYSTALAVPLFSDLVASRGAKAAAPPPRKTGRIGQAQVDTVRKVTDRVADILDEFGGGHARPMAAAFLVNSVGPWLRSSAAPAVHKDLMAAASDLTYLVGWMAMYERQQGLGQRYYVKALELAGEAEDHVTYCRTLRGMSLQASHLGFGGRALALADSAAEAAPKAGPRLVAFLRGQQAHAAAMTGDRHTAFTRLRETEASLSKADSQRESIGGYDQCAYLFHVSHVLFELRDLPGSIKALQDSLKAQPKQERQGRVHSSALLAQRQFELGHVDASCDTWHRFLDDYAELSTARGDEHFETMNRQLHPYRTSPSVRRLTARAREVALLKA
ncbi:hypothetical protein CTZ27_07090 [Streptomyces griseocarneus]|nr:hypothetical protein CTZ27_07090 [Streptomyces griseocarneus]